MKVLIVHAHPEPKSFCAALCAEAKTTLEAAGHTVTVSDLCAEGFKAAWGADDFGARADPDYLNYALEQRHNSEAGTLAPDIRRGLEQLAAADLLILNFPLTWFSVPAVMKGWIDRVLVSGRAYGGKRIYARGGFTGKRALCCVTTGGREDMLSEGGIHGDINVMLRHVLTGTLGYTGMTVLPPYYAWHTPYADDAARTAMLAEYREYLAGLDDLAPLPMPDLSAFDERFFKKPQP
ncbi:MAG: NAD(P)H-dependent oxidoreductase [Rhodospirillales bacterium]